ncbi:MAG TPA: alcohol dehydrogenase catalytic domain-containing protein [Thermoanaerobaculia bacterium]|nr:alcohol dehydrogenase catalytic domain-containing protein [Thermoanaerobaculia bacterium]
MRSAILIEPRRFRVESRETPEPGEGEVRIRVRGCGVCGSDMGPWKGLPGMAYPLQPGAPGHEVFGTVESVGPGVQGLAAGQPVTALALRAYAEYDLVKADSVLPLPGSLADRPVLGEPMACAVNVMRRSGVREGDTVVLLGTGFLGTLLLQLLKRHKPGRVIAVSRRRMDPALAESLGVEVLTYEDQVPGGADVVIEATGRQGPLDLATNLVRVRGRLIVAGYHQDGPRTVNMQLWNWNGIDVINAHERDLAVYRSGMEEGVRLLAAGELDLEPLITHTFPLEEINEAFRMTEERPEGFLKSVVLATQRT